MQTTVFKLLAAACLAAGLAGCADDSRGDDAALWSNRPANRIPDINNGENRYLYDATEQTMNNTGTNNGRPNNLDSPSPMMPGTDGNFHSAANPNMPR